MSRFAFEAINRGGAMIRGVLEAPDQRTALEQLYLNGHTPVSIRKARSEARILGGLLQVFGGPRFDYVALLREFAVLLRAGLPPERALTTLKALMADAHASARVQQIVDRVRGGEAFSQAFGVVATEAPPSIARLLSAGEASGRLAEVTERVAAGLTQMRQLKSRLISDLTYPAVLVAAITIVMWVIFHTVVPRLAPLFGQLGANMPLATEVLLNVGAFLEAYGWVLLVLLAGTFTAAVYALRRPSFRLALDRMAITSRIFMGLPRAFEAAFFCRNLQTVLDGGLPLERAIGTLRDGIANRWLRKEITDVQKVVREGVRLSSALARLAPSLPGVIAEFAAVGEETGRLAPMMGEAAAILEHAAQTRLTRLTTLVVPITTLVMGAIVAGLMAGIVSGILAINDLAR